MNIETALRTLSAAEKVNASRNLTDEDKLFLLKALQDSLMANMPGAPEHLKIIAASITRMGNNERANVAARAAKEQGRKAEGVQEPATVDQGRAEEGAEAPSRSTEGVEEQAEDAGRADLPSDGPAAAKTRRRKA